MNWTALVPIKSAALRKSRLAGHLSPSERVLLSQEMLAHVLGRLHDCRSITRVLLLSPLQIGSHEWIEDEGRGLNEELTRAHFACGAGPLLVIHPDLPLLAGEDLDAALDAATRAGQAIAPDRHGSGTNAVAIADGIPMAWHFGVESFARHRSELSTRHAVIERPGLLLDCDMHADLLIAEANGYRWRGVQSGASSASGVKSDQTI